MLDKDEKSIGKAQRLISKLSEEEKRKQELVGVEFQFVVPDSLPGGAYKLRILGQQTVETRFFVLRSVARQMAVVGDWSQENAKAGDAISGKLSLKLLTKDGPLPAAVAQYEFSSNGKSLLKSQGSFENGSLRIDFKVPDDFSTLLVFSVTVQVGSNTLLYKKDFTEPSFDDIVVDFTVGNGKLVRGAANPIYFRVWENKERKLEVPLKNARLLKQVRNRVSLVQEGLATLDDGKGRFTLNLSEEDFDRGAQFFLENKFDELNSKRYPVVNLNGAPESPVLLELKRLYADSDRMSVQVQSASFEGTALLAIVNKGKVVYRSALSLKLGANKHTVNLKSLSLQTGGVFTVQLYTQKPEEDDKTEKPKADVEEQVAPMIGAFRVRRIAPRRPPPANLVDFRGDIQQEAEIFVVPELVIGASIKLDKERVAPNDEVSYTIALDDACKGCFKAQATGSQVFAMVDVVDESAFLEIEKSRENPSLFTKVFLEKEIRNQGKVFFDPSKYVDFLFDAKQKFEADRDQKEKLIDLLLGNQGYRKFFLDPKTLEDFLQNRY